MTDDADRPDEELDASAPPATGADGEQDFPWQRHEAVDLDLHGAPTWNPSDYEPDDGDESSSAARGKLFRRARPRPSPTPGPSHARGTTADETDAAVVTERLAREQREAEQREAEQREAEQREAEQREAEQREAEQREAEQREAEQREAEQREAEQREAEQREAEQREAEQREAEQREAEQREAEQREAEQREAEQREAEQREAEQREAERVEAERHETTRRFAEQEAERRVAARRKAELLEAELRDVERRQAQRREVERAELERRQAQRAEAERAAADRTDVHAGEEVPVDMIGSEDLDTGGTESVPDVATPPARSSAPPAPVPSPLVPVSAVAARSEATSRPSPFANPMPVEPARDAERAQTVDLDKALPQPDPDSAAESAESSDKTDGRGGRSGPNFLGRHRRGIVRTLVTLVIAALVAILLRVFVVQPYYIPSASMEPTLHGCPGCTDDRVIVDKLSYRIHDVNAGDIVVFNKPPQAVGIGDDVLIKRVIALGGDTLTLKNDTVYVNGLPDAENYLDRTFLAKNCPGQIAQPETGKRTWKIPDDDVFVMGDNRCNSDDSRTFGPIKKDSIIGRAAFIIWPLSRIGGI